MGGAYRMNRGGLDQYIRGLLHLLNPNMSKAEFERNWRSLWKRDRAFSNKSGYEDGEAFAYHALYMGGATFRPTGRTRLGYIEVYAFDPMNMPPPPTGLSEVDWTRHFWPVISTVYPVAGSAMTQKIPFGQFDGRCPLPLIGKGGRAWIQSYHAVPATGIANPFFPARTNVTVGLSLKGPVQQSVAFPPEAARPGVLMAVGTLVRSGKGERATGLDGNHADPLSSDVP